MTLRQLSRMALTMGVLLLLGSWAFPEGLGLACLCGIAAAYFHIMSRRRMRALPDPAKIIEVAVELAYKGKMDQAIALLTKEIRRSPKLWQLHQYRGQLHMLNGAADLALLDINEAIQLAPNEAELYNLRDAAIAPRIPAEPDAVLPPPADR
jgi:tetratricopeptide (TPR) repeat protein